MARKTHKRPIKCRAGEQRFTVVRVNGDPSDTHSGRSFEQAMRSAQPDRGSRVEVFRTCAPDIATARMPGFYRGGILVKSFRYKGR